MSDMAPPPTSALKTASSASADARRKARLGELLVQQGLITADQLRIALTEQRSQRMPIGRLLVRLGFVTEGVVRDIMARTIGQEAIDLAQVVVDAEALKLVPQEFARRHHVLDGRRRRHGARPLPRRPPGPRPRTRSAGAAPAARAATHLSPRALPRRAG